jgi:anti-sigma factor RsiW
MPCAETERRLHAYFDGELDALGAAAFEEHLATCAECRAALEDLREMRARLRGDLPRERAPAALAARIRAALDAEAPANVGRRLDRQRTGFARGLLVGAGGGLLAAALAVFLVLPSAAPRELLLDDLVNAHLRSLLPAHLVDVESTDRHTVKPWFAGHVDVSPAVYDFTAEGYRLVGGRADYFEHQRAAALVYQHGPHTINVFSWAGEGALPERVTRNGYRLAFWSEGNLHYCAISDTGWPELLKLVSLIRDAAGREGAG